MTKIKDAFSHTTRALADAGIANPALEARLLLQYAVGKPAEYILAHDQDMLLFYEHRRLENGVERRKKNEPLAYIVGHKEFFSREFTVDKCALIPRPDTEVLVEAVLNDHPNKDAEFSILDLGTGSGCIIITLLLELPNAKGMGVDFDQDTLHIAKLNALKHNAQNARFLQSNWFASIRLGSKYDVIVSNPPYIAESDKVSDSVLRYEPHSALFAENNGLSNYKTIAQNAKNFLNTDGAVYVEIGYGQKEGVVDIFVKQKYHLSGEYKDLAGYVRCLKFEV